MLGCLGKVPPDRSLFNMSDYIIYHPLETNVALNFRGDQIVKDTVGCIVKGRIDNYKIMLP